MVPPCNTPRHHSVLPSSKCVCEKRLMLRGKPAGIPPVGRIWISKRLIRTSQTLKQQEVELRDLDKKWARIWKESSGSLNPAKSMNADGEKFYCCSMFPYPSGALHMGHLRVYTISDVVARYMRLKGKNVIHPMGWDAFGLPAENAAIENGIDPAIWTRDNINKMKAQMDLMLADFDWDREVSTCDPEFYRWTQKIFLLLVKHGLAYRKKAQINWDPVDQTVLANEQVDSEGRSWRSGAKVEKRDLEQWFIGITKYAKDLAKDCEVLEDWPEKVKVMQKNWIGESSGATIRFATNTDEEISVFTTRPDTLFSVQFFVLSLEHPLVQAEAKKDKKLEAFIAQHSGDDSESKDGYKLENLKVSIPIDTEGSAREVYDVPVYAATYVLSSYGSGAVMGCPGHDTRDFEFWQLHNPNIPPVLTIGPEDAGSEYEIPYVAKSGRLCDSTLIPGNVKSLGSVNGLIASEASKKITEMLSKVGKGESKVQYRIRDWLISRQRYWGAPIPMVHCNDCGLVPVPDEELPVLLPNRDEVSRGLPLAKIDSFVNTKCPSCGEAAKRDTDTMDTFMDSSWYFFRYLDSKNKNEPFGSKKVTQLMPMDIYFGGVEHAILHLLYTRFMSKFLGDIGYWNGSESRNEPIKKLITQGMVQGKTFTDPHTGRFLKPSELDLTDPKNPKITSTGLVPTISFQKMSKSKYNGADPETCIKKYGADATRAHMLFLGPISDPVNWNEDQIQGCERWLKRVVSMAQSINVKSDKKDTDSRSNVENIELNGIHYEKVSLSEIETQLFNETQIYIQKVSKAIETDFAFNTLISDLMKFSNSIGAAIKAETFVKPDVISDSFKKLLIMLAPIAPSVAEEAWHTIHEHQHNTRSIFYEKVPIFQQVRNEEVLFNVFVNGKVRGQFKAPKEFVNSPDSEILEAVKSVSAVENAIGDKKPKKLIVKKGVVSVVL